MTPWLLIMFIVLTPQEPPYYLVLSARTEHGCEMRQQEYVQNLPKPPAMVAAKCVFMPDYWGSL